MAEAKIAQKAPYPVEVEEGKKYAWCACGESSNQPYCDGSHAGGEFAPVMYQAEKTGTVYMCGCKATGGSPMCDGSHTKL